MYWSAFVFMSDTQIYRTQSKFTACAELLPGMEVLDLGWEGIHLTALDKTGAKVTYVTEDIRLFEKVSEHAGLTRHLESDPSRVVSGMDVVLYKPAQRAAKGQVFEWIDQGFDALCVGGKFHLAGRKDRGVASYAKYLGQVFGNCKRVGRLGRELVFCAVKRDSVPCFRHDDGCVSFKIGDVPGGPFSVTTRPGVFSRDGLDPGTRLLIENLDIEPMDRVLDWGCGWGALGMVGARMAYDGQVVLIDSYVRSVLCARENIEHNDCTNATVVAGDARNHQFDDAFDVIVSNPPFHEGNNAAHPLIEGAYDNLNRGGRFMLVVMRPGAYLKHMTKVFGGAGVIAEREGYSVLSACVGTSG